MMENESKAPDWIAMLDNVNERLLQMLAAAQSRIDDVGASDAILPVQPPDIAVLLAAQAAGLQERLSAAEAMLLEVEASLRLGEESARAYQEQLTGMGRKWSEWSGSAIR